MKSKQPIICLSTSSYVYFLFNIFVIFMIFNIVSASYNNGNETDHQALLKIKSTITKDPYGVLTSWNDSLHFCNWTGVICGRRHKRVTYLELTSQGLEGSLAPHVGNLSFLRGLYLYNNSFEGPIPHELGHLSRLRVLYMYQNKFNKAIPTNISGCSNLEAIDLSTNELVGSIPKEISFLSKLTYLSLSDNKLTGGLPPFLGNITSMESFGVTRNPLGGIIPDTLGHWKVLREIYIGVCNVYGTIPQSLYNLSLITYFSFPDNQLIGRLPPTIGTSLPYLGVIELWNNQLTGPLPPTIANCSRLGILEMSKNQLSGKLKIDFAKLRDIKVISISTNNLGSSDADEMKFIDSLENCTRLEWLDLGTCKFQGVLPRSIGNISNQLQRLYLDENQIHGNLPKSIGNLVGLEMLSLEDNQFTGNIPFTIGNLQKLQAIYLYKNQLSGQIPYSMRNLSLLSTLDLSSNILAGVIPSGLGNCQNLLELYLNDNKLGGEIPKQVLKISSLSKAMDLSQNNLFGSLPIEVGDLKMLSNLDISNNNLSGSIPSSLDGCASLSRLSLKGNLFQGTIPLSLSALKGLVELDISHNNLSGQIPRFLARLKSLNLSYNDFDGEVPMTGVFANVSAFSVSGNSKLCGGLIELGLPKCKETKKHTKKVPLVLIVIFISLIPCIIICLSYAWHKKKSKSQFSQTSVSKRYFMKVSYNQLLKATDGFSQANLIGNGGFSSVYKGILQEDDDRFVAIKVLHLQNRGAKRSFIRECEAWQNIRHRNLLKIITSCSSVDFQGNDFKALVYEYMPNGSLHDWLYSSTNRSILNLHQILSILLDVASAIDYIHNECVPSIVHGDLKPSNILLDHDMVAHVGDFGLARVLGTTSYQNSSAGIKGTIGYAPPEYGLGSEMTTSGDVYSFGILLLEVMTRKKPTSDIFNESLTLHKFASMALLDHVTDVIDVSILSIYQENETFMQNKEANARKLDECLVSTIKIGVSCSLDSPPHRMDIKNVVQELHRIQGALLNI